MSIGDSDRLMIRVLLDAREQSRVGLRIVERPARCVER
jgi:hypothetical protein